MKHGNGRMASFMMLMPPHSHHHKVDAEMIDDYCKRCIFPPSRKRGCRLFLLLFHGQPVRKAAIFCCRSLFYDADSARHSRHGHSQYFIYRRMPPLMGRRAGVEASNRPRAAVLGRRFLFSMAALRPLGSARAKHGLALSAARHAARRFITTKKRQVCNMSIFATSYIYAMPSDKSFRHLSRGDMPCSFSWVSAHDYLGNFQDAHAGADERD